VAKDEHLAILQQGVVAWNEWRSSNPGIQPDLYSAHLNGAHLSGAYLRTADLTHANLNGAHLSSADLYGAHLYDAHLTGAYLTGARLLRTRLQDAILDRCIVYGISAWDLDLTNTKQRDLLITPYNEPEIRVDSLEVAQFVYLLLHNEKIRDVIETITTKVVLILGRFTPERKAVLDQVREALHIRGYIPVIFDFDPAQSRDVTETIMLLANLARFVIADLTDAKSLPQELSHVIPHLPSVPIQPLLLASQREYGMFEHWRRYGWVLPEHHYTDATDLIESLDDAVIGPALAWQNPKDEVPRLLAENEALKAKLALREETQ